MLRIPESVIHRYIKVRPNGGVILPSWWRTLTKQRWYNLQENTKSPLKSIYQISRQKVTMRIQLLGQV